MTTFFTTMGVVAGALISIGVLLSPFYKKIKRFSTWLDQFMRDWEGEEASLGRDRVPGVMERLNRLDGELSQNSGKSTKDVVNKLLDNQENIMRINEMLLDSFVEMGERLISIENCLTSSEIDTQKADL